MPENESAGNPAPVDHASSGELEFRKLLEKLPAGAYMCDAAGLITYYNPYAVTLWGRTPKLNDPEDRFCGSFRMFAADGSPIAHDECWMALALRTNQEYNGYEIVVERPDGTRLTGLAHVNPIRDEAGRLLGAVNVVIDITDRKRSENALRDADRSKNEFIATLAHELRNPLAPIRNAAHVLHMKSEASSPEMQWALDVIERQMQHMTRLIDDLLDIARITGNKLELRRERVDLVDIVTTAAETSRPHIAASGQTFSMSLPQEPISVHGDHARLVQVIANLLNNAAKYTPRGGRIRLEATREGSDVVITIRDTGIGIREDVLPHVFEMFAQGDAPPNRSQGGLGIGLTLVKRLVEMHDGSVTAESDGPGTGSVFTVRLPLVVAPPAVRGASDHPLRIAASTLRVVVVDDNHDSASSLGMVLRIVGNDTRIAHDGLEALEVIDAFRPQAVLLDIGLPGLTGYEVARSIRSKPWGRPIVLIAMTGWGQQADRRRSEEAGFDHHLVKPVDPPAVLSLLDTLGERLLASAPSDA